MLFSRRLKISAAIVMHKLFARESTELQEGHTLIGCVHAAKSLKALSLVAKKLKPSFKNHMHEQKEPTALASQTLRTKLVLSWFEVITGWGLQSLPIAKQINSRSRVHDWHGSMRLSIFFHEEIKWGKIDSQFNRLKPELSVCVQTLGQSVANIQPHTQ